MCYDEYYVRYITDLKNLGTCPRRQVAAVLVDVFGNNLGEGYNKPPRDLPCHEEKRCLGAEYKNGQALSLCNAIHAEQYALLHCQNITEIFTCYTTTFPCAECMKLLLATPIQRIVYLEDYNHCSSYNLAKLYNIEILKYRVNYENN